MIVLWLIAGHITRCFFIQYFITKNAAESLHSIFNIIFKLNDPKQDFDGSIIKIVFLFFSEDFG